MNIQYDIKWSMYHEQQVARVELTMEMFRKLLHLQLLRDDQELYKALATIETELYRAEHETE